MQLDFKPANIYKSLVESGTHWANANGEAELLEEGKKSVLSEIAARSAEKSQAGKESEALRDPEYKAYIKEMVGKRKAANIARVEYDAAKALADMRRTEAANERAANRSAT